VFARLVDNIARIVAEHNAVSDRAALRQLGEGGKLLRAVFTVWICVPYACTSSVRMDSDCCFLELVFAAHARAYRPPRTSPEALGAK
jgi:hypothetical protein